jgi:hypothetical protein
MTDIGSDKLPVDPRPVLDRTANGLGIAFGHFLLWLLREIRALKAERVFFLSREGIWFAHHYETLRRTDPSNSLPPSTTLAVSRRSTFLPSLPAVHPPALAPLLAQYRTATVAAILWSLGVPEEMPDRAIRDALGSIDPRIEFAAPGVAAAVLNQPAIAEALERRRLVQRQALIAYLGAAGLVPSREPVVVVDIGWRGTIQDNLARLFPDTLFVGRYFHLQPFLVDQAGNVAKRGFIPEDSGRTVGLLRRLRFVAPLEFVASDPQGSVVRYVLDAGQAKPVRDTETVEPSSVQEGLRRVHERIAGHIATLSATMEPRADIALACVLDYLEKPSPAFFDLFVRSWRDDRFGAGVARTGADKLHWLEVLKAAGSPRERVQLGRKLAESGWPCGLLRRDLPILAPLLRMALRTLDPRLPAYRD